MELFVFKGKDCSAEEIQERIHETDILPMFESDLTDNRDVTTFTNEAKANLLKAVKRLNTNSDEKLWMTYEEYSFVHTEVNRLAAEGKISLVIVRNNKYPDYYPLHFHASEKLVDEISKVSKMMSQEKMSSKCKKIFEVYASIICVDGIPFGSYYNYEVDIAGKIETRDLYPVSPDAENIVPAYSFYISDDVEAYLNELAAVARMQPAVVGYSTSGGDISLKLRESFKAYCNAFGLKAVEYHERLSEKADYADEFAKIAKEEIHLDGFKQFRSLPFYAVPDVSNELTGISQATLIQEIVTQAEKAYAATPQYPSRDIFITASTGSGKSLIFQIPAVYLAKNYGKLTVVIEPIKALMNDQKQALISRGYTRVETLNSDIATYAEKVAVMKRVQSGEVDILYISPETLLTYSLETIIGVRELGLLIIDEAHTVTSWGTAFRPDYWRLGEYINNLRTVTARETVHRFPVCAFTATAVNGGKDDSVGNIIASLHMRNPVKYLGCVKRDDIKFRIRKSLDETPAEYREHKLNMLNARISRWLVSKEKTIVYFPYATMAYDAKHSYKEFAAVKPSPKIGLYIGKNIGVSPTASNEARKIAFENFRTGAQPIMFATKAFGMGVDVNDVKNVYHYAPPTSLTEYVQEIGRAARTPGMTGVAACDFYDHDMRYNDFLFEASAIKQFQLDKVLESVFLASKKFNSPSFLISPESMSYIFNGYGKNDESDKVQKVKTSLLMLENDLYKKYGYKVFEAAPQNAFTKAFVVVNRESVDYVLNSAYGKCFEFVSEGRYNEVQEDGSVLSDTGDIYALDLKRVWEEFYSDISFGYFKSLFYAAKQGDMIMPGIRKCFTPRQRLAVYGKGDVPLKNVCRSIREDLKYICDVLTANFKENAFTVAQLASVIEPKYGAGHAKLIASTLFDLVDPDGECIKAKGRENSMNRTFKMVSKRLPKLMMRATQSTVTKSLEVERSPRFVKYLNFSRDLRSLNALKLLSVFGYVSYDISGGAEPEIFIRINDTERLEAIVKDELAYFNSFIASRREAHYRNKATLYHFFCDLNTDEERWDFIEKYFLGYELANNFEIFNEDS